MSYTGRQERKISERTAKSSALGIEDKINLVSSELGEKETVEGIPSYCSAFEKSVVKHKNFEINMEIICCTEMLGDNLGSKTTAIYLKKPVPFFSAFKYSQLVYASATSAGEKPVTTVTVLKNEQKWLFWLEHLYSKADLDKILKETNRKLTELAVHYSGK